MKTNYTKYTAEQLAAMLRGAQLTVRVNTAQLGRDDVTTRASAREVTAIKAAIKAARVAA